MEINWKIQMHKFVTGTITSMAVWMSVLAVIWLVANAI